MEKLEIIKITDAVTGQTQEHAIIDRGNGEFTSMLKSTYDAMQAEQSTPNLAANADQLQRLASLKGSR